MALDRKHLCVKSVSIHGLCGLDTQRVGDSTTASTKPSFTPPITIATYPPVKAFQKQDA